MNAPPADDSILLPVGTVLGGQYAVEGVLGKPGGFGITYLARDARLAVHVAVKEFFPRGLATRARDGVTLRANTADDAEGLRHGRQRFLEEARMLARFNHPGIVRVRSFFEQHETAYLVMDYLDGLPLSQYLERKGGRLPWETALGVIRPVLSALGELHAVDVLHRDVDPHNVYVTRRGEVVLLDFGTARVAAATEGADHGRSLTVVLKPGYAPYEQYASRGRQGPWTDVYGAAATLYRMVSGVVPQEATGRLLGDELRPLGELAPGIPAHVDRAVAWALALRPEDRPQTVEAFADALYGAGEGDGNGHAETARAGAAAFARAAAPPLEPDPFRAAPPEPRAVPPVLYAPAPTPAPVPAAAPERRPARPPADAPRPRRTGTWLTAALLLGLAAGAAFVWQNGADRADPAPGAGITDAPAPTDDATGTEGDPPLDDGLASNEAPSAIDDAAVTNEDAGVDVDVLRNDFDPEGEPLRVASFSGGEHGEVTRAGGRLRYTPAPGYVGDDRFAYVATDGRGLAAQATVTVTVLPAEPAEPDPPAEEPADPAPDEPAPPDDPPLDGGELRSPPVPVERVEPEYPELARRMGMEGRVVVRALVSPAGRVKEVQVERSDNPILNTAALDAVRRWTFEPAIGADGEPAEAWVSVSIRFRTRD